MVRDTKASKICPHCHNEYPEADNYCGDDGSRLAAMDASDHSPTEGQGSDATPNARTASGRREGP